MIVWLSMETVPSMANEDIIGIRLALQRALLGEITPQLIAVSFILGDDDIKVLFLVDRELGPDEYDELKCAVAEVMIDYPDKTVEIVVEVGTDQDQYQVGAIPVFERKRPKALENEA